MEAARGRFSWFLGFLPPNTACWKRCHIQVLRTPLLQNRDFIESRPKYSLGFFQCCLTSQKKAPRHYSTSTVKFILTFFRSDILRFSQYFIATSTTKLSKLATASLYLHNSTGGKGRRPPFIKSATVKIAARLRDDCSKPTTLRKKTLWRLLHQYYSRNALSASHNNELFYIEKEDFFALAPPRNRKRDNLVISSH